MTSNRPQGWRKGQYMYALWTYMINGGLRDIFYIPDSEFDRLEAEYLLSLKEEKK